MLARVNSPYRFPRTDGWLDWIGGTVDDRVGRVRNLVDEIRAAAPESVLELWNELELALSDADALVSTFAEVHPDEAVRTLCEERAQEISRLRTEISLDRGLYDAIAATPDAGSGRRTQPEFASTCYATSAAPASIGRTRCATACAR